MDIESMARDLAEMKEIRIEAIEKDEVEMVRLVRCLHDIDVLEIHHNIYGLSSNDVKITIRIKLRKGAYIEEWVRPALTVAFEKTTIKFNSLPS